MSKLYIVTGLLCAAFCDAAEDTCVAEDSLIDEYATLYRSVGITTVAFGQISQGENIPDYLHAFNMINIDGGASNYRAGLLETDTLSFTTEGTTTAGLFSCPDNTAIVAARYNAETRSISYNCSTLICGNVGYVTGTRYWRPYIPNTGYDDAKCNSDEVACGACWNDDEDDQKCTLEGKSYTFLTKCCHVELHRDHCVVNDNIHKRTVSTSWAPSETDVLPWFQDDPKRINCTTDKGTETFIQGATTNQDDVATLCSPDIPHESVEIRERTGNWGTVLKCDNGDGLLSVEYLSIHQMKIRCAKPQCIDIDLSNNMCSWESNCGTSKLAAGAALYPEVLPEKTIPGVDDGAYQPYFYCCRATQITTPEVTYTATTTTTVTITTHTTTTPTITSTKTMTTETTGTTSTYTVQYREPFDDCNETLYCLPNCIDPTDPSAYYVVSNFSEQWPCRSSNCTNDPHDVCVTIPFIGDHAFTKAYYIENLFINGNFNLTADLHFIGNYSLAELTNLRRITINASVVDNITANAYDKTDCAASYPDYIYNISEYPLTILDCRVTSTSSSTTSSITTSKTTLFTTSSTTSSFTTHTTVTTVTDPPYNESKVTCPVECTDVSDISQYLVFTEETNPETLYLQNCSVSHVCVQGPYLPSYMFHNMDSLVSLHVFLPSGKFFLDEIQANSVSNVPNLHTLVIPKVIGGSLNVSDTAYSGNPCFTGTNTNSMSGGYYIDIADCVTTTITQTTFTTTTTTTTTTASTKKSSSGLSQAMIGIIAGSSILFVGIVIFVYWYFTYFGSYSPKIPYEKLVTPLDNDNL